jgi:hypothetical protein
MSDVTTTSTGSATVDEGARFRAFTALSLALCALMGGGVMSTGLQIVVNYRFVDSPGDPSYAMVLGSAPLVLSLVALWLASGVVASSDTLASPLGRCTRVLAVVGILGAVLVTVAVLTQP